MIILLKSHGLYTYVTGASKVPVQEPTENVVDFAKRMNEWDINNARILGFINASTTLGFSCQTNVRASLLHRQPLPTLEEAISELISEETRLHMRSPMPTTDSVLYTSHPKSKGKWINNNHSKSVGKTNTSECAFCHSPAHLLLDCPIRKCRRCGITHPRHYESDCPKNSKHTGSQNRTHAVAGPTIADTEVSTASSPDLMELMHHNQEFMEQIMSGAMGMNSPHSVASVRTADNTGLPVSFSGNVSTPHIQLPDVLNVPNLSLSLVLIAQLLESNLIILFHSSGCVVHDPKTKQILGLSRKVGRMIEVVYLRLPLPSSSLVASVSNTSSFELWHARLGHLSLARIKSLAHLGVLGNCVSTDNISCLSCKLGKHHALPFEMNEFNSPSSFDLIHSDVWGPTPHPSIGGTRYFVIFIDDHTCFTWI
ncbi:hypothetical protein L6452_15071 [Arctium lappa]|uniref:Uncharacterized protein n=1 Tax=Arctium lappa TaxID=4217 RepID=A0ACB9CMQ9_ARCLA|nr:hypothetical protein L6452_15071 [Arctium lappa]